MPRNSFFTRRNLIFAAREPFSRSANQFQPVLRFLSTPASLLTCGNSHLNTLRESSSHGQNSYSVLLALH
ncbi:MAG: hypothetical protein DMF68_11260 [Acidobacteria bacterium]|nr:MAG: hypothetical protein DMF68_11260 [Acidobacteriota bacterium]